MSYPDGIIPRVNRGLAEKAKTGCRGSPTRFFLPLNSGNGNFIRLIDQAEGNIPKILPLLIACVRLLTPSLP